MVKRLRQFAQGFRWKGNIYVALALYLLLMMALYMICRISFYFYNAGFFPDMTLARFAKIMVGGLRFDLSALLYLNSLFFLLLIMNFNCLTVILHGL